MNQNDVLEQAIISDVLYDETKCDYTLKNIKPEHFENPNLKRLWIVITDLLGKGVSPTTSQLIEATRDDRGLSALIMDLMSGSYTAANSKQNSDLLLDRYHLRVAHKSFLKLNDKITQGIVTVKEIRDNLDALSLFLTDRTSDKGLKHISKVAPTVISQFKDVVQGKFPGVKTGFKEIDDKKIYFRNGTLNIIGGRPKMGKSALCTSLVKRIGAKAAFFSIEMGEDEQYERLLSTETGMSGDDFRTGQLLNLNVKNIESGVEKVNKLPLWINDDRNITTATIRSQCKRLQDKEGLDIIFVDYLGLVSTAKKYNSRREEVSAISHELKEIAKELNVPVVALAQLNRDCEARPDKRPMDSDLKESGDIEQDAHMIWFVYRGEIYYDDEIEGEKDKAEIIISKNRGGKTGIINLTFKGSTTEFIDYIPRKENFLPD